MSFCWATDTPVLELDLWWCPLLDLKSEWAAVFVLGRGICDVQYLRFIC